MNTVIPEFVTEIPNIVKKCEEAITGEKENQLKFWTGRENLIIRRNIEHLKCLSYTHTHSQTKLKFLYMNLTKQKRDTTGYQSNNNYVRRWSWHFQTPISLFLTCINDSQLIFSTILIKLFDLNFQNFTLVWLHLLDWLYLFLF